MPHPIHIVTRLRLDAALYEPATPYRKGQMGCPRLKGKRLPTLNQGNFYPSRLLAGVDST